MQAMQAIGTSSAATGSAGNPDPALNPRESSAVEGSFCALAACTYMMMQRDASRPCLVVLGLKLCLLLQLCTAARLVSSGEDLITGVQQVQQHMELTGFIRPHAEQLRSLPVVSVNTTLSASPDQPVLLDTGQELANAAPIYVASGVSLLVSGVTITDAAKAATSPPSAVWFPLFALQPGATLQLEDLVVWWNPRDALEVQACRAAATARLLPILTLTCGQAVCSSGQLSAMDSVLSWLSFDGPEGPAQLDNVSSHSSTVLEAALPQAVSGLCTGEPAALPQPNGMVQLRNVSPKHSAAAKPCS